jgi:2-polyprenyl-6-methoxyphenol hydroxylase-like FAD-dependent oxidoreductase
MVDRVADPRPGKDGHAVVIGGGMAGLLAARVLSEHFGRVTTIERDSLPDAADPRKGVPQGRHAHALLPRGQVVLEKMFPGLSEELVSRGGMLGDRAAESRWHGPGGYRVRFTTAKTGLFMSRPLLEDQVRRRVRALPNVTVLQSLAVSGLLYDPTGERVGGVTLKGRAEGTTARGLVADLVVDAGGRGSRAPAWLEALGYERPVEEEIRIGVRYTTRLYRHRPNDLPGVKFVIIQPTPGRERRFGAMFRIEDERWMVTLGGWLGDNAPTGEEGFVEFARGLPASEIFDVIEDTEALGKPAVHNFPANLRRRYERLSRVPEGFVVTGDALCSFNPIYGQGMTVSALEAATLEECLREGQKDLPRRFYQRVSTVIDTPWKLAAGADFAHPGVTGDKARTTDLINWYIGHVQRAATRDELVCRALLGVTGLLAPPASLFRPKVALRVLRYTLARHGEPSEKATPVRPTPETA